MRKEAERKIPKLDEQTSVVEYSSLMVDKAEESDAPADQSV